MAVDVDLRSLKARADSLAAEAKTTRKELLEEYGDRRMEVLLARDRAAREQYGAEQAAKSAEVQAKTHANKAEKYTKESAQREVDAAKAEQRGDRAEAREGRENVAVDREVIQVEQARAREAGLEAARLRETAAKHAREVKELETKLTDVNNQGRDAERELDKLEQQADLVGQAQRKLLDAQGATDDPVRQARLQSEAESLLQQADAIEVDREVIRQALPEVGDVAAVPPTGTSTDPGDVLLGTEPTVAAAGTTGASIDISRPDGEDVAVPEPGDLPVTSSDDPSYRSSMTGDFYEQQWALKTKVEALTKEAASARTRRAEEMVSVESEMMIDRDRAARHKWGEEQEAKSADIQVERELRWAENSRTVAAKHDAEAARLEKAGDRKGAAEQRENAQTERATEQAARNRAKAAEQDAVEHRAKAAEYGNEVEKWEDWSQDFAIDSGKAEAEIDKIEQQADLLQQARMKLTEADLATDNPARAAILKVEADQLVAQAEAIVVDRGVIRAIVPEFPESTPGYDDPPPPIPDGTATDGTATDGTDSETDETGTEIETDGSGLGGGLQDVFPSANDPEVEPRDVDGTNVEQDVVTGELPPAPGELPPTLDLDNPPVVPDLEPRFEPEMTVPDLEPEGQIEMPPLDVTVPDDDGAFDVPALPDETIETDAALEPTGQESLDA